MISIVINLENKEPITIYVLEPELKLAKNLGLSDIQYITTKVKITLEEEYKESA